MLLLELQLGRILDGDDALVIRDGVGQHVEQRGLARAGTAGDQDVEADFDGSGQDLGESGRESAESDQIGHTIRVCGEPPDGDDGPVQRERRNDRVDARAVRKAGVHHRRRFVDAPPDPGHDTVDDLHQMRVAMKGRVRPFELAAALDVNVSRPVDEDVGYDGVLHQRLEWPEAEGLVPDLEHEALPLLPGERCPFFVDEALDDPGDLRAHDLRRDGGELVEIEPVDELPMNTRLQLGVLRFRLSTHWS